MELLEEFPYIYELHMHTAESSACATSSAIDMATAYRDAGYAGLFITNHNWGGNTAVDRKLSWNDWIDAYFLPYYEMKQWGEKNDFKVFCGMETGFGGPEFLIFGLEPEFWHAHPELHDASPEEQYRIVHEAGGLVYQAHPMRSAWYIDEIRLFPDCVDGVEAFNAAHSSAFSSSHNNKNFNDKALTYAKENGFAIVAGSDCHSTNLFYGGTAFKKQLQSATELCSVLRTYTGCDKEYVREQRDRDYRDFDYVVTDSNEWFTPYGEPVLKG